MKKSINQGGKGRWLGWLVLFFSLFLLGNNAVMVKKLWRISKKEKSIKQQLAQLQQERQQLQSKLDFVQSEDFVNLEARQKLGLGKKDDIVYILPTPPPNSLASSQKKNQSPPNWKQWWQLFWY
jgi:cell division protein FtsB